MESVSSRKKTKSRQIDMLNGPMFKKMIIFAMPLALSGILQQLFNSADVIVVGRFAGNEAFAAVGANVANVGLFVNLLTGMSVGPNVVIANLIGQGNTKEVKKVVQSAMLFALIGGIFMMALSQAIILPIMENSGVPANVFDSAMVYIRIYLAGLPFILIYNFGAAVLRSIGDTRRPLYCLIAAGIINVALNLLFVIVFNMSVSGVALATLLSNVFSSAAVVIILLKEKTVIRLEVKGIRIYGKHLKRMLVIGLPAGLQGMVFSLSNMFIQTGINSFGESAIAGSSAALNYEYFTYSIAASFGQAAVTFCSQNYGAGQFGRCRKVYWLAALEGAAFTQILCTVFTIWVVPFASIYSEDNSIIEYAVIRMLAVMALEAMTAIYEAAASSLRGIGYSLLPTIVTVLCTVGFRLLWLVTVFRQFNTFAVLMYVYPVSWGLNIAFLVPLWLILSKKKFRKMSVIPERQK